MSHLRIVPWAQAAVYFAAGRCAHLQRTGAAHELRVPPPLELDSAARPVEAPDHEAHGLECPSEYFGACAARYWSLLEEYGRGDARRRGSWYRRMRAARYCVVCSVYCPGDYDCPRPPDAARGPARRAAGALLHERAAKVAT